MYSPRFFSSSEFRKCKPSCEISDMDESFLIKLDLARELARTPFILNSAYRSLDYEKSKGRSGTSSHCKGVAVDLSCKSSHVRMQIVSALIRVGFRRIGVYPTFIHVDSDEDKITTMWLSSSDITRG